jgi:hypothetical protein
MQKVESAIIANIHWDFGKCALSGDTLETQTARMPPFCGWSQLAPESAPECRFAGVLKVVPYPRLAMPLTGFAHSRTEKFMAKKIEKKSPQVWDAHFGKNHRDRRAFSR